MSINFEYYKVFYYVAKYKNITHAANELCVTQPSVTKSIQNLEAQIGCQLFHRSKRGVLCTPEGALLYDRIKLACDVLLSAETELQKRASLEQGAIKISTPDLALRTVLLPVLKRFNTMYPRVTFHITRADTMDVYTKLGIGAVDLFLEYIEIGASTLGITPTIRNSEILMQSLGYFYDIPIVGPKYAFLAEQELSFQDLLSYPIILPTADTFASRSYYKSLLREYDVSANISMEISGVDKRIDLVANDIGISFFPKELVEDEIRKGRLYPLKLKEKLLKRQLVVMTSQTHQPSLAAKAFINMLIKSTRQDESNTAE